MKSWIWFLGFQFLLVQLPCTLCHSTVTVVGTVVGQGPLDNSSPYIYIVGQSTALQVQGMDTRTTRVAHLSQQNPSTTHNTRWQYPNQGQGLRYRVIQQGRYNKEEPKYLFNTIYLRNYALKHISTWLQPIYRVLFYETISQNPKGFTKGER